MLRNEKSTEIVEVTSTPKPSDLFQIGGDPPVQTEPLLSIGKEPVWKKSANGYTLDLTGWAAGDLGSFWGEGRIVTVATKSECDTVWFAGHDIAFLHALWS